MPTFLCTLCGLVRTQFALLDMHGGKAAMVVQSGGEIVV